MKNFHYRLAVCLLAVLLVPSLLYAQMNFEFVNQDVQEIVYILSLEKGFPIVCDDTVTGKGSFRFSGSSFDTAFNSFLQSNRLYVKKEESRWLVSRISLVPDEEAGVFSLDASDVLPARLFEQLSVECGITVVHDVLPATSVTLHAKSVDAGTAAALIMKNFPGYGVSAEGSVITVEKEEIKPAYVTQQSLQPANSGQQMNVTETDGLYTADLSAVPFLSVINSLTESAGIEYCSLVRQESVVSRCSFQNRPLDDALSLICAQASAAWTYYDGMYVFYTETNADKVLSNSSRNWHYFDLRFIEPAEALASLKARFAALTFTSVAGSVLMANCTEAENAQVLSFLEICDRPENSHVVTLKYVSPAWFLEHLPPCVTRSQFTDAGRGNMLFFTGSQEAYAGLEEALVWIDVPSDRISYDLLIVQVQKSSSDNWNASLSACPVSPGSFTDLSAAVSPFGMFNIDVVAAFGYTFAAGLSAAVADNKAEIYADTVLHGVSGTPINFRNTNTYRYRDPYIDDETGKKSGTGVTREIVSGLVLDVTGWVSGDGMITTKVNASISRQGADVSSSGNPPPTSEKIVTTEVRGKSGEVIVLSGLIQDDTTTVEDRTPLISKIPLLGWLFKKHQKTEEKNEMYIYLVPHLEGSDESAAEDSGEVDR